MGHYDGGLVGHEVPGDQVAILIDYSNWLIDWLIDWSINRLINELINWLINYIGGLFSLLGIEVSGDQVTFLADYSNGLIDWFLSFFSLRWVIYYGALSIDPLMNCVKNCKVISHKSKQPFYQVQKYWLIDCILT